MANRLGDTDAAREIVLNMLADGTLLSKANHNEFYFRQCEGTNYTNANLIRNQIIPSDFWQECSHPAAFKSFNWKNGYFKFDGRRQGALSTYYGSVFDVIVDLTAIERALEKMPPDVQKNPSRAVTDGTSARGRKPANWWPGFAEELAVYLYENGLPEGDETEGQGALIRGVFDSLAERGLPEPSRTQIQPVINAVLARVRAAGK